MSELLIGIDLGGTNIKAGVVTSAGEVIVRDSAPTLAQEGHESIIRRMSQLARVVIEKANVSMDDVIAVGVGAPGPLSAKRGVVIFSPNLGWKDVPLAAMIAEDLGKPTYLENDAGSACWGEFWAGAGAGDAVHSMIILTLGTGVGGGVIMNGELIRGSTESAGHIGHLVVEPDGRPCVCGGIGCLEQYASATAVARAAREALEAGGYSRFLPSDPDEITAHAIAQAADRGCSLCDVILRDAGRYLGLAIASLANVINPDLAVLSGGMAGAGERLFGPLRDTVNERALPMAAEHIRIERAALGEDAGFVGAAGLAMARHRAGA